MLIAAGRSSNSQVLRRKVELVIPVLRRSAARLVEHPDVKLLYLEFLIACHFVVRASVPLMERAAAVAAARPDGDAVARGLREYLPAHIEEERDHDEWVLEDLETIGVDRATVLERTPSATVASLVGAQYYWIEHYHPVALLGYISVLEGSPPAADAVAELTTRTGYEAPAFRTLLEHADLDPHHADELYETIDRLPLTREQSSVIGLSAMHTVATQALLFDEIVDRAGRSS